ncbi:hypothetical protein D3H65_17535 [Paraflavitalea soli]|uniref:Outer membrane protein beta-barrel domain-containing protein n=1 Tax=Paraflavitalea soli TaxID=2315862 RepID=A0A3B7MNF1_9BACT|nr:hypothetical protein [Paraflavitalea soli]AXY75668.1 hypothetical protein D3H65_17535 [Paraflavitalea soli]
MQKKHVLLFIACLPVVAVLGQGKKRNMLGLEFQGKLSMNYDISLTQLLNGGPTDDLLGYEDRTCYLPIIGLSLFFDKHWGLDFNFQAVISNKPSRKVDQFSKRMQAEYSNHYYVDPFTSAGYTDPGGAIQRGFLGLIYRLESRRFFMYPKFSLGITSFEANYGRAYLKEKESNKELMVFYATGKPNRDHFTIAASSAFGYKLCKWLYFNVDLQTSWYKTNISYIKTITDLESGQVTSESIRYKKNIFNLGLGGGFIVSIK